MSGQLYCVHTYIGCIVWNNLLSIIGPFHHVSPREEVWFASEDELTCEIVVGEE